MSYVYFMVIFGFDVKINEIMFEWKRYMKYYSPFRLSEI